MIRRLSAIFIFAIALASVAVVVQFAGRDAGTENRINVYDYGARGEGATDDTAAIQTAIDVAPPGSVVFFPLGNYCIKTGPLTVTSDITLRGPGRLRTCGADISILSLVGVNNTIANLEFDGDELATTTKPAIVSLQQEE